MEINTKCVSEYPSITYRELKKHASYTDAWVSINGIVYDITDFIPNHPFGDTFRGNLGTECGGLFSASHINTDVEERLESKEFLERNGIKIIGHLDVSKDHLYKNNNDRFLDRVVYKDTNHDAFWLELKQEVKAYLSMQKEDIHYSSLQGILYVIYYGVIFVLLSYWAWISGSVLAAVLLGFHMVCSATNVAHMATHFGFTKNRPLNFIAGHFFDLGGLSWLEWQIIHQTHHNQPHSPIDYQTNQYVIRIHEYMTQKDHHKYQHIYFWFTVLIYHLASIPISTFWLINNKEFIRHKYEMATHIMTRFIFFSFVLYCAYLHGFWFALMMFSLYSIAYSYTAFILLYNDHEDTHYVLAREADVNHHHNKWSWAEIQVRTSNNWYPTNWFMSFVEFHYGYFNFHIEHHLFPSLKPILLKKISPIVRRICHKHGVPYISTTFVEVQKSFQRHIMKMSGAL